MTGAELRKLRLEAGLQVEAMADLLNVDRVTLWRWENRAKLTRYADLVVRQALPAIAQKMVASSAS